MNLARQGFADPLREALMGIAEAWSTTHVLRGDSAWWHLEPSVDRPARPQGWKVHVSAVPITCAATLRAVADVVMPQALAWKVTRSVEHLSQLCAPPSPVTQVGKFITVYAAYDEPADVESLAAELHQATQLFDGPVIPSDHRYCRGSNVYLRYGAYSPQSSYEGPEQTRSWFVVDGAGRRVADSRKPGQDPPPWVAGRSASAAPRSTVGREGGLFGRGITVVGVLRQSAKGGVYRATWRGKQVVLKEARIGTCADLLGRDARDRLLNEWRVLKILQGTGLTPDPYDFFFEQDNAYLLEEHLDGETLRDAVTRMNYCDSACADALVAMSHEVADVVARISKHGVVLRDLTPNNIMVSGDRYTAIDLELSTLPDATEPPFEGRTPGYTRPTSNPARPDADEVDYALAAVTHFILTGIDPYLGGSNRFSDHVDDVLDRFAPREPVAAEQIEHVRRYLGAPSVGAEGARRNLPRAASRDQILSEAVAAGVELVHCSEWDSTSWPLPAKWGPGSLHPASFMSGTAGIARFYLDLWKASGDRAWIGHADDLVEWTCERFPYIPPQSPPGLYFGMGALPWLMAELAGVSSDRRSTSWSHRAVETATRLRPADPDLWDITHGSAGIGLTLLAVLLHTGDSRCRDALGRVMRGILQGADHVHGAPFWRRQARQYHGFAHGSAGIGHFLLAAGLEIGDTAATDTAIAVGRALRDVGVPVADGRGLSWKQGPDSAEAPWTHWCNGAAGVGAFFLSLWSATGDATFHDAAVSAGRAITSTRPFGSCCRCHGLAGDGDFLLDLSAAGVCGAEFRHAAEHIGAKLDALAIHDSFAVKWPHEGNGEPRPGYMRGYTGVHSFRLRLAGLIDDGPLSLPEGREHDDH
jgi:tRNA A-37 threonylcarbamoyl transferase component Bud32